jgi:hypothetical protein
MAMSAFVQGLEQKPSFALESRCQQWPPSITLRRTVQHSGLPQPRRIAEQMINDYPSDNSGRPRSEPPEKPLWGSWGSFESLSRNVPEQ